MALSGRANLCANARKEDLQCYLNNLAGEASKKSGCLIFGHRGGLQRFVVNGWGDDGLEKFAVPEIMSEDKRTLSARPVGLIEEKITQTIINWLAIIKFKSLGLVGLGADY